MKCRCRFKPFALVAVGAGILIILALIVPPVFWWFLLGILLIAGGVALMRCR